MYFFQSFHLTCVYTLNYRDALHNILVPALYQHPPFLELELVKGQKPQKEHN